MLGYCSNSPLRCKNARSAKMLNLIDSCCPECNLFLLPVRDVSQQQLRANEQFLRFSILAIVFVLFVSVYVYYLNFV